MKQILLAPSPFQTHRQPRFPANADNDDVLPLPLPLNLPLPLPLSLPGERSRGSGRGRFPDAPQGRGYRSCLAWTTAASKKLFGAGGTRSKGGFESYARISVAADV